MLYWRLMCECVCVYTCHYHALQLSVILSLFYETALPLLWSGALMSVLFSLPDFSFLSLSCSLSPVAEDWHRYPDIHHFMFCPLDTSLFAPSWPLNSSFLVLPSPPLPFRLALKHSVGSSFADLHADKTLAPCMQSDKEQLRGLFHCRMLAGYPELKVRADQSFDCSCLSPSGGSLSHFLILPL